VTALAAPNSAAGQTLREALLADMQEVFPETQDMDIMAEVYLLEDDCEVADVSPWHDKPEVATGIPGLVLAGYWIGAPLPVALMERAATTGFLAANALLAGWDVTGQDLHSPPRQGMLRRSATGRAIRNVLLRGRTR